MTLSLTKQEVVDLIAYALVKQGLVPSGYKAARYRGAYGVTVQLDKVEAA